MSPSSAQVTINRIVRAKKGYAAKHTAVGAGLDPKMFTSFYVDQCKAPRPVHFPISLFTVPESFKELLLSAVRYAPTKKTPGLDMVIGESLRLVPEQHTEFLFHMWIACGELGVIPQAWKRGLLVPIHKRGNTEDPANYRPITLLSHGRKVVEKAVDKLFRQTYTSAQSQFGFQSGNRH